jgi:hypothetical protein
VHLADSQQPYQDKVLALQFIASRPLLVICICELAVWIFFMAAAATIALHSKILEIRTCALGGWKMRTIS